MICLGKFLVNSVLVNKKAIFMMAFLWLTIKQKCLTYQTYRLEDNKMQGVI
jgi:hypothetical protein